MSFLKRVNTKRGYLAHMPSTRRAQRTRPINSVSNISISPLAVLPMQFYNPFRAFNDYPLFSWFKDEDDPVEKADGFFKRLLNKIKLPKPFSSQADTTTSVANAQIPKTAEVVHAAPEIEEADITLIESDDEDDNDSNRVKIEAEFSGQPKTKKVKTDEDIDKKALQRYMFDEVTRFISSRPPGHTFYKSSYNSLVDAFSKAIATLKDASPEEKSFMTNYVVELLNDITDYHDYFFTRISPLYPNDNTWYPRFVIKYLFPDRKQAATYYNQFLGLIENDKENFNPKIFNDFYNNVLLRHLP